MNRVIVIGGATASGKTSLAVRLAQDYDGEIINADSVQIYQKLNIGSAKPTVAEQGGVPHHLMDFLPPDQSFSVADFCACAKEKTEELLSRGKVPVFVGGTGLYLSSFMDNLSFAEQTANEQVRKRLFSEAAELGNDEMYRRLCAIDPVAAEKIHPNNIKRVLRAIEIFETTGKTMTEQNRLSKQTKSPYTFIPLVLDFPRDILYQRIDMRVDKMVADGLFEEVRSLFRDGVDENAQSMQAIGYKETVRYIKGEIDRESCIEQIKQNSRRYAKRQITWFKREPFLHFQADNASFYDEIKTKIGEYGL